MTTENNQIEKKDQKLKNNISKKKKKKRIILVVGIFLLVLIVIAIVVSGKKEKLIEVQTEKISKRNITQIVTATGKIQSEVKVNISAEISGEIVALPIKEGVEVKKGDLLVKINPEAYYPQVKMEQAGVKVQQNNLKAREVDLKKMELELQRIRELVNKGLAPQSELDNAQASYDLTLANINTVRAQIEQQKASLSKVQYDLSKTTIYSPMSGTVTALNNEIGEKVLGTSFNLGSQIMTISDLSKMECQVDVSETDVTLVKIGDTARIQIDAFPDKIFTGYVYEIANSATAKSLGTQEEVVNFIVKIRIINEGFDLRPGMSCTVDIEVNKKENILAVPIQSVTAREDEMSSNTNETDNENLISRKEEDKSMKKKKIQEIVFVIENGIAKKKAVKTGISDDSYIEIIEGLNEGDEVVKGSFKAINKELEDNTKVKVDNEKKKTPKDKEK